MKIRYLLIVLIIISGNIAFGQSVENKLYPIEIQPRVFGTRFIYDRQLINNPLALQIPILQARDPKASYEFLMYKAQKQSLAYLTILPTAISLYAIFNRDKVSDGFYWSTVGGSFLVSTYLNFKSAAHLRKAILRYNQIVSNQVGVSFETLPNHQPVLGLGFVHKF
ncbi:hypothetical protein SAMN04515674_103245 [Pseudarcicella hirudinis]|uniref:Uncharacterized protein n=1 Tax=Pseudarcicella hirudinis TaxID=1079859 RepID=A0A1I5QKA0_9BACT|nr:hypothetical protein [Pseudarcicella hirudinis]SFP46724.1 hypothetical protein SAMN04515674_103245 [Pseudarcicella hirudinis]